MILKKLFGNDFSIRKATSSVEDQKYALRFKALQLGLDVVEQDEILTPLYYTEQLHNLITQRQTASIYNHSEKLTDLPVGHLETELTRVMFHSYTLLRALSWSVQKGSSNAQLYANAVTGFVSDTLHNAPSLLKGKLFVKESDLEHKLRLANIIEEYVSLLVVLKEHLEKTKLDEKVRHDIGYYYDNFKLTDY